MRKVDDGKKEKRRMKIVATTSLPAVDRPNADRWNAARSCQKRKEKKEKRMAFLVATTSLPAVYRPNGYARMMTAGTPHARAKNGTDKITLWFNESAKLTRACIDSFTMLSK